MPFSIPMYSDHLRCLACQNRGCECTLHSICLISLMVLGAPRELIALIVAMEMSLIISLAIALFWKGFIFSWLR